MFPQTRSSHRAISKGTAKCLSYKGQLPSPLKSLLHSWLWRVWEHFILFNKTGGFFSSTFFFFFGLRYKDLSTSFVYLFAGFRNSSYLKVLKAYWDSADTFYLWQIKIFELLPCMLVIYEFQLLKKIRNPSVFCSLEWPCVLVGVLGRASCVK